MWIDAHAFSNKFERTDVLVTGAHYLPGIVSTLGLIMCATSSPVHRVLRSSCEQGERGELA